jgi:AcrR family transcriptional regulator
MSDPRTASVEGRPRGRTARGEGRRLRSDILIAAAQLLDETGDEQAVTLRAVARRVGVSAPALYGHFRDRQEILVAVVRTAFEELTGALTAGRRTGVAGARRAGRDEATRAAARLRAVCAAYLDFAAAHPQRYRVMFGGLWSAAQAVEDATLTSAEAFGLGRDALAVVVEALQDCVRTGASTSADTTTDAVALWIGLHGLAHQRAVIPDYPWPPDIAEHLIGPLARLSDDGTR